MDYCMTNALASHIPTPPPCPPLQPSKDYLAGSCQFNAPSSLGSFPKPLSAAQKREKRSQISPPPAKGKSPTIYLNFPRASKQRNEQQNKQELCLGVCVRVSERVSEKLLATAPGKPGRPFPHCLPWARSPLPYSPASVDGGREGMPSFWERSCRVPSVAQASQFLMVGGRRGETAPADIAGMSPSGAPETGEGAGAERRKGGHFCVCL